MPIQYLHTDSFPFESYGWNFAEANAPPEQPGAQGRRECVLVVDDEPLIGTLARTTLQAAGYRTLVVHSGEECLRLLQGAGEPVDLIILDLIMPGWSGVETLRSLGTLPASPPVLLSSGYTSEHLEPQRLRNVLGFLKKPYRPQNLVDAVRHCLAEHARR